MPIVNTTLGLVDSPMLSTMQIQLAKSLATLPADLSAEEYLRNICDQMIALWPVGLRENDKVKQLHFYFLLIFYGVVGNKLCFWIY